MNGERLACLYSYKCEKATNLGINDQLLEYIQNHNFTTERRNLTISLLKKLVSYGKVNRFFCFPTLGNFKQYWSFDKLTRLV